MTTSASSSSLRQNNNKVELFLDSNFCKFFGYKRKEDVNKSEGGIGLQSDIYDHFSLTGKYKAMSDSELAKCTTMYKNKHRPLCDIECIHCHSRFTFCPSKIGSSAMQIHIKEKCKKISRNNKNANDVKDKKRNNNDGSIEKFVSPSRPDSLLSSTMYTDVNQKTLNKKLVNYMVQANLSFSQISHPALGDVVNFLHQKFNVPSRPVLTETFDSMLEQQNYNVLKMLSEVPYYSLTTDSATSNIGTAVDVLTGKLLHIDCIIL